MAEFERRDAPAGGRRCSDGFTFGDGNGDDFVRRSELDVIIRIAVRQALDEYEHECIMDLRPNDAEYVRDLMNAIREIGAGDLPKGISIVRENHKFVRSCQSAATKIGWGVIIVVVTIMSSMGLLVASAWKAQNGGQ